MAFKHCGMGDVTLNIAGLVCTNTKGAPRRGLIA